MKKTVSIILALAMTLAICTPAFAASSNALFQQPEAPAQLLQYSVTAKIEQGFFPEVESVRTVDGGEKYTLVIAGRETEITEKWLNNGLEQVITEGELTNTLFYNADGSLYVDGIATSASITYLNKFGEAVSFDIAPRIGGWIYDSTPYYSGGSYSIYLGSEIIDADLGQKIALLSIGAFIAILSNYVKSLGTPGMIAGIALSGISLFYDELKSKDGSVHHAYVEAESYQNTYYKPTDPVEYYCKVYNDYYYDYRAGTLTGWCGSDITYGRMRLLV